ncbi:heat stress transcription factor A-6b-like [Henckelia pumila]|uniref:heat stress transcription factor A-6b-like n=1 Tax=Henckelia pumila TaxID=405737 RepID=UPI003C6E77FA
MSGDDHNIVDDDDDGTRRASPTMDGDLDISEFLKGMMGCMPAPPPFLIKTYNIVNDPKTNSVISWSSSGTSFIIWDHLRFSAEILPLHFKHNILSSFVSQLNNYGFRKIGVDHQWEYENPYFQAGNEDLLLSIRRRNQIPEKAARRRSRKKKGACTVTSSGNCDNMETKLGTLRGEIETSKLEIQRLKKQQQDMELLIANLEANMMNSARNESNSLLMLLSGKGGEFLYQKMNEELEKIHSNDGVGEKRNIYDHTHGTSINKKQKITAT